MRMPIDSVGAGHTAHPSMETPPRVVKRDGIAMKVNGLGIEGYRGHLGNDDGEYRFARGPALGQRLNLDDVSPGPRCPMGPRK